MTEVIYEWKNYGLYWVQIMNGPISHRFASRRTWLSKEALQSDKPHFRAWRPLQISICVIMLVIRVNLVTNF